MDKNQRSDRPGMAMRAARTLAAGAAGTSAAVALSLFGAESTAAGLALMSVPMMLWGLHRYGRLGADPPLSF